MGDNIKKIRYPFGNIPTQIGMVGDDIADVKDDICNLKNAFKAYINLKKQEDISKMPLVQNGFSASEIKNIVDKKYKDVDIYLE